MDEEKNEILCRLINELANGKADALGEIYKILGLTKEQSDAIKVLGHNYPQSKWYKRAKKI